MRGSNIRKSKSLVFTALAASLLSASVALAAPATPAVAVAPQYDTTHVYVAPEDVDRFAAAFLATFGGQSTRQVVATVTPTPSAPPQTP